MNRFIICLLSIFLFNACQEQVELSDAYGNFEATATTISSEANGRLLFLRVEEGRQLEQGVLVAIVDTTTLDLQRKQVQATIRTLPKKLRNTLADIEVLKNQKNNLVRERDRVKRLLEKKSSYAKTIG